MRFFRSTLVALVALCVLTPAVPASAAASERSVTFVNIVSYDTDGGASGFTAKQSAALPRIVRGIDRQYRTLTGNQIRIVYGKLYDPLIHQVPVANDDSPFAFKDHFDGHHSTDLAAFDASGARQRILNVVVVVDADSLNYCGKVTTVDGPSADHASEYIVLIAGYVNLSALTHEIGHTFGLGHSAHGDCKTDAGYSTCAVDEYGDTSDFMGTYWAAPFHDDRYTNVERLSGVNLDQIGALNGRTAVADQSGTFRIDALYTPPKPAPSTGTPKPSTTVTSNDPATIIKVLYIPIANQMAYGIEFRPAMGYDIALQSTSRNTDVPKSSRTRIESDLEAAGVQIRLLPPTSPEAVSLWPVLSIGGRSAGLANSYWGLSSVLINNPTAPRGVTDQAFHAGQSYTLLDGTIINIISASAYSGAVVKVTRP